MDILEKFIWMERDLFFWKIFYSFREIFKGVRKFLIIFRCFEEDFLISWGMFYIWLIIFEFLVKNEKWDGWFVLK